MAGKSAGKHSCPAAGRQCRKPTVAGTASRSALADLTADCIRALPGLASSHRAVRDRVGTVGFSFRDVSGGRAAWPAVKAERPTGTGKWAVRTGEQAELSRGGRLAPRSKPPLREMNRPLREVHRPFHEYTVRPTKRAAQISERALRSAT